MVVVDRRFAENVLLVGFDLFATQRMHGGSIGWLSAIHLK